MGTQYWECAVCKRVGVVHFGDNAGVCEVANQILDCHNVLVPECFGSAKSIRTLTVVQTAVDMLLYCPNCGEQHIDEPQPEKNWTNPPHRSHECQDCGHIWRPCDLPTNGVAKILTQGQRDGFAKPKYFATADDFDKALEAAKG
jgi:hypothetical protein